MKKYRQVCARCDRCGARMFTRCPTGQCPCVCRECLHYYRKMSSPDPERAVDRPSTDKDDKEEE